MKSLNQVATGIAPSGIRRLMERARQFDDVISLGIGEPDFPPPACVLKAVIRSVQEGNTGYTPNAGLPELRTLISEYVKQHDGLCYDPVCQILVTAGVSEAMDLTIRALINPGDQVIIIEPTFVSYMPVIRLAGGSPVVIAASPRCGFRIPAEAVAAAITRNIKAIIICNPNNPTGVVEDANTLRAIRDLAVQHDLFVIADEIYERFLYDQAHMSLAGLEGAFHRTILLRGFSKTYAMTGFRVAYACGPRQIIEAMLNIHQHTMACAPHMAQRAAIAALKYGGAETEQHITEYDLRRGILIQGLKAMGLFCPEPFGAFYAFPSVQNTGLTSEEFANRLLEEERVVVVPGNAFGLAGEGFVRCAYSIKEPLLNEALKRIERFVFRCADQRDI